MYSVSVRSTLRSLQRVQVCLTTKTHGYHFSAIRNLNIQVEPTPNENSLKFVTDEEIFDSSMSRGAGLHLDSLDEATQKSPLAKRIFETCGSDKITSVFVGSDFVSVNKTTTASWPDLQARISSTITEAFESEEPMVTLSESEEPEGSEEDEIVELIKEMIDTRIRPTVQEDGGDIFFIAFENGIVKLRLAGSCVGCASSEETLYNGVEQMLKYYIPEVEGIEQITDTPLDNVNASEFDELEQRLQEAEK